MPTQQATADRTKYIINKPKQESVMFTSYHLFLEQGSESQPISIGLRDVNEYIRYIWMINISVPQKYPDIFFIKDLPQVVAFLTRSPIGTYTQTDIKTSLRLSDKNII